MFISFLWAQKSFLELDKELTALAGKFDQIETMFVECRYLEQLPSPHTCTRATCSVEWGT